MEINKKTSKKILLIFATILMLLFGFNFIGNKSSYNVNALEASSVYINNISFSATKLYYKNGEADVTNDSENYNAYYNPLTNTLTLNNYVGDCISIGGALASDIIIDLVGTNTINTSGQIALNNTNGGNILITSQNDATLNINLNTNRFSTIYGITTSLTSSVGDLSVGGNATIVVNVTGTNEQIAYGVFAGGEVKLLDNASLKVNCATNLTYSGIQIGCGIYSKGLITINTTKDVFVSTKNCESINGNIGIYSENNVVLNSVKELKIETVNGSYATAIYPASAVNNFENFNKTETSENGVLTTTFKNNNVQTYTITLYADDGKGTQTQIENISGLYVLPNCTFEPPAEKTFYAWAIGSKSGEQKQPGSAINVESDTLVVAIWTDSASQFETRPNGGVTSVNGSFTIKYRLNIQPETMFVEFYNDYQQKWAENWSIATIPTSLGALTYFDVPCVHQDTEETIRFRLLACLGGVNYYSNEFAIKYTNNKFTTEPINQELPLNTNALVNYAINFDAQSIKLQYDNQGVWEHYSNVGSSPIEINGSNVNKTMTFRIEAVNSGDYYYSKTFTIEWNENFVAKAFSQEIEGATLLVNTAKNISWSVNFDVDKFEIMYYDTQNEMWDQFDIYDYDSTKPANELEDYDFQNYIKESITFKIMAYVGNNAVLESNEFTINWVGYAVSFDNNGGTGSITDYEEVYGDFVLPKCTFGAPQNKEFLAWAVGSLEGIQYQPKQIINVTNDITIYPVWVNITITEVTTYEGLVSAINNGDRNIKIMKDINFLIGENDNVASSRIVLNGSKKVTIDFNSYLVRVFSESLYFPESLALIEVNDYSTLILKNGILKYQNESHREYTSAGLINVNDYGTLLSSNMELVVQKVGYGVKAVDDSEVTLVGGRYETLSSHTVMGLHNATIKLTNGVILTLKNNDNSSTSMCVSLYMVADNGQLIIEDASINGGIVIYEKYFSDLNTESYLYFIDGSRKTDIYECTYQEAVNNAYPYHWLKNGSSYYFLQTKQGYYLQQNVYLYSKELKTPIYITNGQSFVNGNSVFEATWYDEVTIVADEIQGKEFVSWEYDNVVLSDPYSATTTFVMTYGMVEITAIYRNLPVEYLEITFDTPTLFETIITQATVNHEGFIIDTSDTTDIQWNDITENKLNIDINSIFIPGHTYQAVLRIERLNSEYSLSDTITATINGEYAEIGFHNESVVIISLIYEMPQADFEVLFTEDSRCGVGGTLTLDLEKMCEESVAFEQALQNEEVTYEWYKNNVKIENETSSSYRLKGNDVMYPISVIVRTNNSANILMVQTKNEDIFNIMTIDLLIPTPQGGSKPTPIEKIELVGTTNYGKVTSIAWYHKANMSQMNENEVCVTGVSYPALIYFTAEGDFDFHANVNARINGIPCEIGGYNAQTNTIIILIEMVAVEHTHIYDGINGQNDTHHWEECIDPCCLDKEGSKRNIELHSDPNATCQTSGTCVCGKTVNGNHKFEGDYVKVSDTHHARKCSVAGCQEISIETEVHSGGESDCKHKKVCEICHSEYGEIGNHKWSNTWDYKDENGHAKKCTVTGCNEHDQIHAHTPNIENPTESQDKHCTECLYVIEPMLNHVHNTTRVPAHGETCTQNGNIEYYTCDCGKYFSDENATQEITNHDSVIIPAGHDLQDATCTSPAKCKRDGCDYTEGEPLPHNHSNEYQKDETNHWNECVCGDKANLNVHTDNDNNGKCDVCDYQMTIPNNKKGIGVGGVIAIVVGSTVVVACGGFAIFWFIIKKKDFAELVKLTKEFISKLTKK